MDFDSQNTIGARLSALSAYSSTSQVTVAIVMCLFISIYWKNVLVGRMMIRSSDLSTVLSTTSLLVAANCAVYITRHIVDEYFFSGFLGGITLGCIFLPPRIASALKRTIQEFWSNSPAPGHAVDAAVDL